MEIIRKSYVKHFIEYNICYPSKKSNMYSRYVMIVLVWLIVFVTLIVDDASLMCQEARGFTNIKVVFIVIAGVYSVLTFIFPIWYRKLKMYDNCEELVVSQCMYYMYAMPAIMFMSLLGCVYVTQGVKITGIVSVIAILSSIMGYIVCKHLILGLIKRDGFNQNKKDSAFRILKTYCDIVLGTKWLLVGLFGLGAIGKHSGFGVACVGFYCALIPTAMVILPVCCNLQIKYAREYGLQEYLPTKSVSEIEKEEEEELIKSVEETEK